MKSFLHRLLPSALAAALAVVPAAAIPLNFQGRLNDAAGNPVSGVVSIEINLYDAATGGSHQYKETVTGVNVVNGIYSFSFGVSPDGDSPGDFASALEVAELWVELTIDGSTLGPRQRLSCVPYALRAMSVADGSITERSFQAPDALTGSTAPSGTAGSFGTVSAQFGSQFADIPAISVEGINQRFVSLSQVNASGFSFSLQPMLRTLAGNCEQITMTAVNGNPAVAVARNSQIEFIRALDPHGEAWAASVIVARDQDLAPLFGGPTAVIFADKALSLAVVGGRPAVAFPVRTGSSLSFTYRLAYAVANDDNGTAWTIVNPVPGGPTFSPGGGLSLAEVDGKPMVALSNGRVWIYRSTNPLGLDAWSFFEMSSAFNADTVDLAVVNGNPAVAFRKGQTLSFVRATDAAGATWPASPDLVTSGAWDDLRSTVSLQTISGNPAVVYSRRNGPADSGATLQLASDASGGSWGAAIPVPSGQDASFVSLSLIGGRPAVACISSDSLQYVRATNNQGTSWASPIPIAGGKNDEPVSLMEIGGYAAVSGIGSSNSSAIYALLPDSSTPLNWTASELIDLPVRVPPGSITSQSIVPGSIDGAAFQDGGIPASKVDLTSFDNAYVRKTGDTMTGNLTVNGTTTTGILTITGGADIAEPFAVTGGQPALPGSVMVIDPEHPGSLELSDRAYDKRVAGIVSGAGGVRPGLSLQQDGILDQGVKVALTGRVYVRATAAHGAIEPGDLLTTSDLPGHAARVDDHARAAGAVIGKAMTPLEEGEGLVLVLVSLQ